MNIIISIILKANLSQINMICEIATEHMKDKFKKKNALLFIHMMADFDLKITDFWIRDYYNNVGITWNFA